MALGVAIGIAAMVAVLGISDSSKAGLVAELNELDTAGVAPLAQVTELFDANGGELRPVEFRQDELRSSLDRSTVLAEAPETNGAFFKVPKVIDR